MHISYLQAFIDVNKRTARLSANIPLIKNNLVPLSFNDINKEDYNASMIAIYELQEIAPLLDLYIFSYMRTCALYDSTVKALGFDEIRVRYRAERRAILREIIEKLLVGESMKAFISEQSVKRIPKKDRDDFIQDILEDLKELNQNRIVGLGVTSKQLKAWQRIRTKTL